MTQGKSTFERWHIQAHILVVGNFVQDYQAQFLTEMARWSRTGQIKYKEGLWPGLEQLGEPWAGCGPGLATTAQHETPERIAGKDVIPR
jgi:NADPH-dependent curcumin reductase CurA